MTTPATWQDEHDRLSRAFAHAAEVPGCTWEQWRDAWSAAERCKAEALGLEPRQPNRDAWTKRHSGCCTMRGPSALKQAVQVMKVKGAKRG